MELLVFKVSLDPKLFWEMGMEFDALIANKIL
jgi:hypothetical protein